MILVPPRPGAPTRRVTISTRSVAGVGTVTLALIAAAATWTGETSNLAASAADRLAESQRTVIELLDSVRVLGVLAERVRLGRLPPRDMIMPVSGEISSRFATSRLHPILSIFRAHRGVDLAAPLGRRIVAPAAGRVRYVGWRFGYGLTVELEHTGAVVTRYSHCSASLVRVGDHVNAGTPIATVGSSGLSTGPHVHFEVLRHGTSVDPIKFLAASRAWGAAERTRGNGQ